MTASHLLPLIRAIASPSDATALHRLAADAQLALEAVSVGASRQRAKPFYLKPIGHYVYAGDTALHIAAAGYRARIVRELITLGADPRARNRRGATPLHYAADGSPGSSHWNPNAQAAVIELLVRAGAEPNATDKSGVAPLHRAVRTRCAAAVRALLALGADPYLSNGNGSTPRDLALHATGRGGSGSPLARAQRAEILQLLDEHHA
ncbi:MAG TPA: ankyrin repeat domain-containing protein [Gemmatimonadaceae bacterium]|nr:ankyrin repeat domain-containing protein [Gemmatimonadaceae bacterium]